MTISRREFLKKSALALAFAAVAGAVDGLLIEPNWIRNREYELVTPKWPKEMGPLTIAIAADLHVGCPSVSLKTIDKISKRLNDMNADMILLLGDFLTARGKDGLVVGGEYVPPEPIAERLAQLHAPLGVHAVLGNHDWLCDGRACGKPWRNPEFMCMKTAPFISLRRIKASGSPGLPMTQRASRISRGLSIRLRTEIRLFR